MTDGSYYDRTEEENYALFINALAGMEDGAGIENYSREGIRLLGEALKAFQADFRSRYPEPPRPVGL